MFLFLGILDIAKSIVAPRLVERQRRALAWATHRASEAMLCR